MILLLLFEAKLNNVPETLLDELSLLGGTEFEAELLDPIKNVLITSRVDYGN